MIIIAIFAQIMYMNLIFLDSIINLTFRNITICPRTVLLKDMPQRTVINCNILAGIIGR